MYPDFCFGYLYTMSQKTSLLLADVARYVPSSSIGLEDYYLTGVTMDRLEWKDIWDETRSNRLIHTVWKVWGQAN